MLREDRIFIIMIIEQSYNIMTGGGVKATSRLNIIITRLNMLIIFFLPTFPSTRSLHNQKMQQKEENMCRDRAVVTGMSLSLDYPL